MNLLGGAFDESQHLCVRQTELGCKDWDGLTLLNKQEMLHYSERVEGYPIYYLVEELHGKPVPYSKTIEKEKEYKKIHDELYNKGCDAAMGTWSPAKKEVSLRGICV